MVETVILTTPLTDEAVAGLRAGDAAQMAILELGD